MKFSSMDKQKLKDLLLINRMFLYSVLDGAAVPDLPVRLYESQLPNYCLFRGELSPDVVHMAPYVVALLPGNNFTDWILEESFGKNWGIFAHCRHSMNEMRKHFRSIFQVHDEDGNPLLFRFYDPRVFRSFIPTCEMNETIELFGKIDTYFAEAEDKPQMLSYRISDDRVVTKEIDLE